MGRVPFERLRHMRSAGVTVGFGTDLIGPLHTLQCIEFELRSQVFSNFEILHQATAANARIIGAAGRLGEIRSGALADILLVDGDPLEDLGLLQNERELALCARLASFAELVQDAAAGYAPHQIAFYLKDLAADFHSWYNAERMLVEDEALKLARLALAAAVRQVLVTGLKMLGVSAPESM